MHFLKFALLASILFLVSYRPAANAGEKGGSGINGADLITLENFEQSRTCPEVYAKRLCEEIDQKMNYIMWEKGHKSADQQNQEEFFYQCCMTANDKTEKDNGK